MAGRIFLFLLTLSTLEAQKIQFSGKVVDFKSGGYLLSETHTRNYKGNQITGGFVSYYKGKEALGSKSFSFPVSQYCPTFTFNDKRTGWMEALKVSGSTLTMSLRKAAGEKTETKSIPFTKDSVCDDGIDIFLREKRNEIAAGKTFNVRVVVPNKFDYFNFVAKAGGSGDVKGRKTIKIDLVTQSALLRALMPALYFTYYLDTGELVNSAGLHIMNDDGGKSYRVKAYWGPEKKS